MKAGDKFIYTHSVLDNYFGLECEVLAIRGDKIDFRPLKEGWKQATCPLDWILNMQKLTEEEINKLKSRRRRVLFRRDF